MATPLVSIILPTYNVEKYLRECLDSLICQTLSDIEIIVVDDGSPDRCGEIMDEYAARDSRIRVIHQPNQGYGAAVNRGFAAATGEYVAIVEPDDWVEPDIYEKLYSRAKECDADICKSDFFIYNSYAKDPFRNVVGNVRGKRICDFGSQGVFGILEAPELMEFHPSIWSSIYKRSFLVGNDIRLVESANSAYQDMPFMVEVYCRAKRIVVVGEALYHWRVEPTQQSSTVQRGERNLLMVDRCHEMVAIAKRCGVYEELKGPLFYQIYVSNGPFISDISSALRGRYRALLRELFAPIEGDEELFAYGGFTKKIRSFIWEYILKGDDLCKWNVSRVRNKIFKLRLNRREISLVLLGCTLFKWVRG
ncbi:MAG: glycosyltransferase [Rikenellaceae bacterium]